MHKLKRIVFNIMFLSFIIKANECYGMETNENKGGEKTVMEGIKALPYPKIFIYGNKLFFSLAHSIINNFYELETLEMNKVYSLKKYLCWGYRLQPTFMTPYSFLDFNVNILGGIIDTAIFLYLYRSSGIKTPSKIFYSLTSFLNINLNIRIKSDFYIAINILGLMRAIFMPFLTKNSNEADKNDNNLEDIKNINENENNNILDINLLGNNNPGYNNENNILNNYKENDINLSNNNNLGDNNENYILNNYKENDINKYNNNPDVKKENDIILLEKSIEGNVDQKNKTDENKNHNDINLDANNKIFNQENNNNNQENNNEDKLGGKKNLGKPNENNEGINEESVDKMYEELDEEYGISGFKDEDEVKEKIREKNCNREEIVKWIEESLNNN